MHRPIDVEWTLEKAILSKQSLFDIDARTTNKPLLLFFQDSPVGSTLYLNGRTSNARIDADLHIEYEGHIYATTTNEPVGLVKKPRPDWDYLRFNDQGTRMHGYVQWGLRPRGAGRAVLETTNAPIVLNV
jgi:hypothetical protein